ncbi:MAG: FAD binding domain-containing protein, partial [Anaerolineaceae bacterium]|nr:FAD binding domain-containing protein [Anaerolineaceae bacterium]
LREYAFPLVQACASVASPQLRNRGTVVGNLVTASPANDTIPPLMAMGARLVLVSQAGERIVPLGEFYKGVRQTVLRPDEYVREIIVPQLQANQAGSFKKSALRRAQAIAVTNCCVLLTIEDGSIQHAAITLGSVAPTIIHATEAEAYLVGKRLNENVIATAAGIAAQAAKPISDIRASQDYRSYILKVLVEQALEEVMLGNQKESIPEKIATLDTKEGIQTHPAEGWNGDLIRTNINGQEYTISGYSDRTLLSLIRDRIGLMGTKSGCEEGECGACTIFMDGKAVVSCLVPAPRAHGARITTIEGIAAPDGELHPVQEAFVEHAAVQCGYCTPGFVMSAVKLLQEIPNPNRETIQNAISGNLCRCTGYYKIIAAIESASLKVKE